MRLGLHSDISPENPEILSFVDVLLPIFRLLQWLFQGILLQKQNNLSFSVFRVGERAIRAHQTITYSGFSS